MLKRVLRFRLIFYTLNLLSWVLFRFVFFIFVAEIGWLGTVRIFTYILFKIKRRLITITRFIFK